MKDRMLDWPLKIAKVHKLIFDLNTQWQGQKHTNARTTFIRSWLVCELAMPFIQPVPSTGVTSHTTTSLRPRWLWGPREGPYALCLHAMRSARPHETFCHIAFTSPRWRQRHTERQCWLAVCSRIFGGITHSVFQGPWSGHAHSTDKIPQQNQTGSFVVLSVLEDIFESSCMTIQQQARQTTKVEQIHCGIQGGQSTDRGTNAEV